MSERGVISRALVTGATGMVGSWLVKDLLMAGVDVVALILDADPQCELLRSGDIDHCAVVNGALEDLSTLERAIAGHEVDTVFHLGAQTIVGTAQHNPLGTWETNIRGTYNLLEACRRRPDLVRQVVVASSDKAYGEAESLPYTEESPLAARHPYEVSKACGDLIAQSYHHTYGVPVAIARCGNVYGGGDLNWSRVVPGTIRSLLRAERPVIRSDGSFVRDYLYVRDAAAAYFTLAANMGRVEVAGQAFNFSDESPLTVLELVTEIARAVGSEDGDPLVLDAVEGEIHDQSLSAGKARSVLGWRPGHDLAEGLAETVSWYREHLA